MTANCSAKFVDPLPIIEKRTRSAMIELGTNMVNEAKSLATGFAHPTGRLLNSIMMQMEDTEVGFNTGGGETPADSSEKIQEPSAPMTMYVGTNVSYAIYVETGTRTNHAHPLMRPAIAIWGQGQKVSDVMKKWNEILKMPGIDAVKEVVF